MDRSVSLLHFLSCAFPVVGEMEHEKRIAQAVVSPRFLICMLSFLFGNGSGDKRPSLKP